MKRYSLYFLLWTFAVTLAFAEQRTVRVLSVGNSFSRDAFSYLPFLIEELSPDTRVEFGILYIAGCPLENHHKNMKTGKPAYEFDYYDTTEGKWQLEHDKTMNQGLDHADWDIVVFQQQSTASRYYETYQPYLDELLAYVHNRKPQARLAWLMTQAYGDGFKGLNGMSSDEMWARINTCSERVLKETQVSLLIPASTAIQNARHTELDRLGDTHHLVNDGFHIQEGIPSLIEGLVAAKAFLSHYGVDVDVCKSKLTITPEWREERNTPQPHGEPEEATAEEYALARQCAAWALQSPWQITCVEESF